MFGIGFPELILILGLALIVVGPDKLPDLARSLAKGIMELKKTAEGFKESLHEEGGLMDDIKPDLEDAAKTFKNHVLDLQPGENSPLFPEGNDKSAADSAAEAYAELSKTGVDTTSEIIDVPSSDVTELTATDTTDLSDSPDTDQQDATPPAEKAHPRESEK